MSPRIPLSVPTVGARERDALIAAVESGWIAPAGPQLDAFEARAAQLAGRDRAVAVSSGTAALHLALLVAGVRPGDVVVCPTLTFIASASSIVLAQATPMFVDSDETGSIDPALVDRALGEIGDSGRRVGAVLAVDLYGKVADHDRLQSIADAHGVPLVVDAAESLGATDAQGRRAGSAGLVSAFSFNGNKIATASSGGAVLTDDPALADRARHLATQAREPVLHYEHREIGFNYRLSNILAALGLAQLEQLDDFIAARRSHRAQYRALAEELPGLEILGGAEHGDNCWMSSVLIDPEVAGTDAKAVQALLAEDGIESRPVFAPMHGQPVFADAERYPRLLNGVADRLYRTGLSLPSSPASSPEDISEVCERIRVILRTAAPRTSAARPVASGDRL
ncbi:aminotransferase class I/II-fold pyridoxal phosphate-dependent enzyme [Brachybacterium sp. NPDC056505]|uniref:aminotransferase class I/II-fold pyridoxal phosphate-dependent enzyme n=1 Tax=Brachybacterium sp. NPDC056505 TaxID=3345843 RepID=UPI00366D6970